jgi:hypothetical protein
MAESMLELRCSSLPRIARCPASALAPEIPLVGGGPEADLGSAAHEGIAAAVNVGYVDAGLCESLACKWGVDLPDLSWLVWEGYKIWQRIAHEYPEPDTEKELEWVSTVGGRAVKLTGHADLVSLAEDEDGPLVRVADWKTGHAFERDHADQLKGYALLACERYLVERARVEVIHLRTKEAPWLRFSRSDLRLWWQRLVEGLTGAYEPGEWCGYCPRAGECPARRQALAESAATLLVLRDPPEQPLQAWQLGKLHEMRGSLARACERAGELLKAEVRVRGGRVPVGGGRELVLEEERRQQISPRAIPDLVALLGEDAYGCCTVSKTKATELAMAGAPRGQKGQAARRLMEDLAGGGFVGEKGYEQLVMRRHL